MLRGVAIADTSFRGNASGIGYLISFAIGASIITILLWIIRFLLAVVAMRSFRAAYTSLPSFHIRKMWMHGCTAGLLWSVGNFCSMISVEHLGEGVGYSVIQVRPRNEHHISCHCCTYPLERVNATCLL